jgi:hypothetical protein
MHGTFQRGLPIAFLAAAWVASSPALAENGKWRGRAVLVVTSEKTVSVADKNDHTVAVTEYDGLVFTEVGGDFLANARYQVTDLDDSGGMVSGGYKTFTMGDGSKVFAQYTLKEANPPIIKGEWKFISGTGKYKDITGSGNYEVHIVEGTNGKVLWDVLEGEYKVP